MLTLEDDEIDLLLPVLKWVAAEAHDRGDVKAFSAAAPMAKWAMHRLEVLIARLAQDQADTISEQNNG